MCNTNHIVFQFEIRCTVESQVLGPAIFMYIIYCCVSELNFIGMFLSEHNLSFISSGQMYTAYM